jgi:hypothetical protein
MQKNHIPLPSVIKPSRSASVHHPHQWWEAKFAVFCNTLKFNWLQNALNFASIRENGCAAEG